MFFIHISKWKSFPSYLFIAIGEEEVFPADWISVTVLLLVLFC